jgi:hypothetical protein
MMGADLSIGAPPALRRSPFPAGHTVGVAYARIFGPELAVDPSGRPVLHTTGSFDCNEETPIEAICRAAKRWRGIEPVAIDWRVQFEEDVVQRQFPGLSGWLTVLSKEERKQLSATGSAPSDARRRPESGVIPYHKVFLLEYLPERLLWAQRGLSEATVPNEFRDSWYLTRHWRDGTPPVRFSGMKLW